MSLTQADLERAWTDAGYRQEFSELLFAGVRCFGTIRYVEVITDSKGLPLDARMAVKAAPEVKRSHAVGIPATVEVGAPAFSPRVHAKISEIMSSRDNEIFHGEESYTQPWTWERYSADLIERIGRPEAVLYATYVNAMDRCAAEVRACRFQLERMPAEVRPEYRKGIEVYLECNLRQLLDIHSQMEENLAELCINAPVRREVPLHPEWLQLPAKPTVFSYMPDTIARRSR